MSPTRAEAEAIAYRVPCRLCGVPAGSACVNSVTGDPREMPHLSRVTAGRLAGGAS